MARYCVLLVFLLLSNVGFNQTLRGFTLPNINNININFNDIKGKKLTVVDFWATWCKPCMKAIPKLSHLSSKYRSKGVQFIGINGDGPRNMAKVGPLTRALQIDYLVLLDPDLTIFQDLNVSTFPTLLILNENNEIIWRHEGFLEGDERLIEEAILNNLQ
ncbi:MAG: TlpA family protein disulfide reductase [Saprospiraceae bacterium]|jgi:thiol-disulfide isomerase/thioredoxin